MKAGPEGTKMIKKGYILKVGLFLVLLFCCLFLFTASVEAKNLNVPLFNQLDSRWASVKLGFSNLTIGGYGCALTSKAMVFNYYLPNFTDPKRLNSYLKNHNGYVSSGLIKWNNCGTPSGVSYGGSVPISRSVISQKLNQGSPLVGQVYKVRMPMHFVVLTGESDDNFLINDPWQGIKTSLEKRNYHLVRAHLYQKKGKTYVYNPPVKKSSSLRITKGLWLKSYTKAYVGEPFDAQFTVKNFSGKKVCLKNLTIFVRGPKGQNFDFRGSGKIALRPKQSYFLFRKTSHLGRRGIVGTYTFSCSYQDLDGCWRLLTAQRGTTNKRKLRVVDRMRPQLPPSTQKLFQIEEDFDNENQIDDKDKVRIEDSKVMLDSWQKVFSIQTKKDFEMGSFDGVYFDEQKQGLRIKNPQIKILQIYPPNHNKDLLAQIIRQYAPDPKIFSVSSVSIRNFNQKKFDNGRVLDLNHFNLLYFGVADVYGSNPPRWTNDLNATGESLVRQFHTQGKGIVFTHDTLGAGSPCWLKHNYFNRLRDITGITTDVTLGKWKEFRTVNRNSAINPNHPMLNYPFAIPAQFPVIHTHRLYQKVIAGEVFAYGQTPTDLYWQAFKNSTFFSYGNVEQMPLEWEGEALINTLFNTYQGGSYFSPIFDSQSSQGKIFTNFVTEDQNPLTDLEINLRFGNHSLVDNGWSDWMKVTHGQKIIKQGRFFQYQVKMRSANLALSPIVKEVKITCDPLFYPQGSVVSIPFHPKGITSWSHFDYNCKGESVRFDLLEGNTNNVLIADLKRNQDLSKISFGVPLKVRISFITDDFLQSPEVDWWKIFYYQ